MPYKTRQVSSWMKLSRKKAAMLADILETTWGDWERYCTFFGGKQKLVRFFSDYPLDAINEFGEQMDYLSDKSFQEALIAVGAKGTVTFARLSAKGNGTAWTHVFEKKSYSVRRSNVWQLSGGEVPIEPVRTKKSNMLGHLEPNPHFEGRRFMVQDGIVCMPKKIMEEAIERMGGRVVKRVRTNGTTLICKKMTFDEYISACESPLFMAAKPYETTLWDEGVFFQML